MYIIHLGLIEFVNTVCGCVLIWKGAGRQTASSFTVECIIQIAAREKSLLVAIHGGVLGRGSAVGGGGMLFEERTAEFVDSTVEFAKFLLLLVDDVSLELKLLTLLCVHLVPNLQKR